MVDTIKNASADEILGFDEPICILLATAHLHLKNFPEALVALDKITHPSEDVQIRKVSILSHLDGKKGLALLRSLKRTAYIELFYEELELKLQAFLAKNAAQQSLLKVETVSTKQAKRPVLMLKPLEANSMSQVTIPDDKSLLATKTDESISSVSIFANSEHTNPKQATKSYADTLKQKQSENVTTENITTENITTENVTTPAPLTYASILSSKRYQ